jgi:hypothetical protein
MKPGQEIPLIMAGHRSGKSVFDPAYRRRRISEIEQALARPAEEGREWQHRRNGLEHELGMLQELNRRLLK